MAGRVAGADMLVVVNPRQRKVVVSGVLLALVVLVVLGSLPH